MTSPRQSLIALDTAEPHVFRSFRAYALFRETLLFFLRGFDNRVAACLTCSVEGFLFLLVLPRASRCSVLCGCIYSRKVCLLSQLSEEQSKAWAFKMVHILPSPALTNPKPCRCCCTRPTSATRPKTGTSTTTGPPPCWRSSSDR